MILPLVSDIMILSPNLLMAVESSGALYLLSLENDQNGRLIVGRRSVKLLAPNPPPGYDYDRATLVFDRQRSTEENTSSAYSAFRSSSLWTADPDRDVYVVTLRVKGEHGVSGDCIIIGTTGSLVRMASTTSVLVPSEDAEAFVDLTVLQPPSSSWQWDSWAPGRATHTSKRILRGYLPTWNTVDVCGRRIVWKARAGMGVTAVVEGNVNYSTKNSSIRERQSVLDTVN